MKKNKFAKYNLTYLIGLSFYQNKKWVKASRFFLKTLRSSPNNPYANFKLGMCYFKQKQWNLAYPYIHKAVSLFPEKSEWAVQLYQSQMKLDHSLKLTTTSSSIKETLLREQINANRNSDNLYYKLSEVLHKQGKYWQEIESLKKAIELKPNNQDYYIKLAKSMMIMKRYDEAINTFQQANNIKNINNPDILYEFGYCYDKLGMFEEAKKIYKNAINCEKMKSLDNYAPLAFSIGMLHEKKGLWFEAVNSYKEQLLESPLDADLHQKIGFAYQKCFDWNNACCHYELSINLKLNEEINPEWYYRLGFVNEKIGNYENAIKYYEKALNLKYTSYWYYRLGVALFYSNKFEESTISFLKVKKDFFSGKINLSFNSVDKLNNYLEKSINIAEKLITNDTTNISNWEQLTQAYINIAAFDKAEWSYYNTMLRKNEYDSDFYYNYGLFLAKLGKFKEASSLLLNIQQLQKPYGLSKEKFNKDEKFREAALYHEYYNLLHIKERTILFESFSGVDMSCNPFAIFLNMIKDKRYSNYLFIWVINDISKIDKQYKQYENVVFIEKGSDAYLRYLCTAQYLVNNSTFPPYFMKKDEQSYLNTWHGTPWKTLGKDIKNNFMELKNTERNFLHSTHILSPNAHTTWVLMDRYDIKEIYSGKLLESGYPRIDLTLNMTTQEKNELRQQLGIDSTKKTILYAPTWRGTLGSPEIESQKLINEIEALSKLNINLLFRGHYFVENNAYEAGIGQFIVPESINTNQLLSIIDILVTDYSSIAFDFMVTGNPIVYYLDDYEEYKNARGLYFEVEDLPGTCAINQSELIQCVTDAMNFSEQHPLYKEAQCKFVSYEDGHVTQRVVDWFIHGKKQNSEITFTNNKKSLLFFGGEFLPNGITTSLINLLNNIDKERFTVSLLIDPDSITRDEKRLQQFTRLSSDIHIIPRVGRMNRSIEDDWIEYKVNQYKFIPELMKPYFEKAYNQEFHRIVGNAHFDALIEFTGYSKFWAYVLGSANLKNATKLIYQHNDKYGEWKLKHPGLENTFNAYYLFDKIISVSKPTMELNCNNLSSLFHVHTDKFDYCDNVQNPEYILESAEELIPDEDKKYFIRKNNGKIFINLARLSPEKGQAKLIRSFKKLLMIYPDSKLLILGDGPLKAELDELIKQLKIENNVFLLGIRFNPFPYLKQADCFVLSSNHEGQPMTLFEAMILDKPIISTDIVGSRSALEGRSGHLVENSDEGLFLGMKDFIEGKLSFDKFDYKTYQQESLEMFYQKVLNM